MINKKIETSWWRRLLCRHNNLAFLRNIYGDEINAAGGNRSWWLCRNCGKELLRRELHMLVGPPDHLETALKIMDKDAL